MVIVRRPPLLPHAPVRRRAPEGGRGHQPWGVAMFGTLRDVELSSPQQEAAYMNWIAALCFLSVTVLGDDITIADDAEGVPA